MEREGSLLVVVLCPVSETTHEPNENSTAFLKKLNNLDLDS